MYICFSIDMTFTLMNRWIILLNCTSTMSEYVYIQYCISMSYMYVHYDNNNNNNNNTIFVTYLESKMLNSLLEK